LGRHDAVHGLIGAVGGDLCDDLLAERHPEAEDRRWHARDEAIVVAAAAAEVPSASALYHAAEKVRDAGYTRWDVYSPFPVHGMDHAMGLKKSWLSALVFCGGLTGLTIAALLQFYPSSIEYPLVVAGKPTNFFTVPAFFPIMFELTILLSAFTATFGMLALNGLPRWNHPMFNWNQFKKN
jgi:hypothetical protein